MSISQRLKSTLESEVQRAEERISRYDEEKKEMQKLLQEEKKEVEESEKNLNLLKETMMLMTEQLKEVNLHRQDLRFPQERKTAEHPIGISRARVQSREEDDRMPCPH
jgi:hypothetical protein